MSKEIFLIDKDKIVESLENFVKSFCGDDVENYTDLIEGVNYAIAEISVTEPKAKIYEEPETAYWIPTYGNVKCSNCGNVKDNRNVGPATHYCDYCGKKIIKR